MSAYSGSNDTLPSTVPSLASDGSNWSIFVTKFKAAMAAKKKWGHFDGSSTRPHLLVAVPPRTTAPPESNPTTPTAVAAALPHQENGRARDFSP